MKLIENTPIETYEHKLGRYYVKREDLSCPPPGPPFSKVRGLMRVLEKEKAAGTKVIGYTETSISMAGWGIAWGCHQLGLKAVIFDPQYKETPGLLKKHRKEWAKWGAKTIPISAGRAKVNYYIGKKVLKEQFPNSKMFALGIPFQETIEETVLEAERSDISKFKSVVVNVGSGTIAAGVLRAFKDIHVYGVLGRTGNLLRKRDEIIKKSGLLVGGFFGKAVKFRLIDPGWAYTERCTFPTPFPCHPYYDAKAFLWMLSNLFILPKPILFWNIGAMPI